MMCKDTNNQTECQKNPDYFLKLPSSTPLDL